MKNIIDQIDLTDVFRSFNPTTEKYTFFSSAHRAFSWINHILDDTKNLNKFKKIEIIPGIFSTSVE